jgi:hypothetical protein
MRALSRPGSFLVSAILSFPIASEAQVLDFLSKGARRQRENALARWRID